MEGMVFAVRTSCLPVVQNRNHFTHTHSSENGTKTKRSIFYIYQRILRTSANLKSLDVRRLHRVSAEGLRVCSLLGVHYHPRASISIIPLCHSALEFQAICTTFLTRTPTVEFFLRDHWKENDGNTSTCKFKTKRSKAANLDKEN